MSQALIALVAVVLDEADKFALDKELPESMRESMVKHAARLRALYHSACAESSQVPVVSPPRVCSRCRRMLVGREQSVCENCAAAGN